MSDWLPLTIVETREVSNGVLYMTYNRVDGYVILKRRLSTDPHSPGYRLLRVKVESLDEAMAVIARIHSDWEVMLMEDML